MESYKKRSQAALLKRRREAQEDATACDRRSDAILDSHRLRPPGYPLMSQVRPSLFLGSMYDALDRTLLEKEAITHAVNLTPAKLPEDNVLRLCISIEDDVDEDIFQHFVPVCRFVTQALLQGGHVLLHCEQGISRSATLVLAFLMQSEQMQATTALAELKTIRPIACPNKGFWEALIQWEALLCVGGERPRKDGATVTEQSSHGRFSCKSKKRIADPFCTSFSMAACELCRVLRRIFQ